jgi:hypothetical protein
MSFAMVHLHNIIISYLEGRFVVDAVMDFSDRRTLVFISFSRTSREGLRQVYDGRSSIQIISIGNN